MPSLVAQASATGTVIIPADSPFKIVPEPSMPNRLSGVDHQVLAVASQLKQANPRSRVIIATDDKDIRAATASLGVEKMTSVELRELVDSAGGTQPLKKALSDVVAGDRSKAFWGTVSGLLGALASSVGLRVLRWTLTTAPYWGTAVVIVVGSSRVDLQACKLEYSIVSPK